MESDQTMELLKMRGALAVAAGCMEAATILSVLHARGSKDFGIPVTQQQIQSVLSAGRAQALPFLPGLASTKETK